MKFPNYLFVLIIFLAFSSGFYLGFMTGIITGAEKTYEGFGVMLEGTTFNIDINETLIADRFTKNFQPIIDQRLAQENLKPLFVVNGGQNWSEVNNKESAIVIHQNCSTDTTGRNC